MLENGVEMYCGTMWKDVEPEELPQDPQRAIGAVRPISEDRLRCG